MDVKLRHTKGRSQAEGVWERGIYEYVDLRGRKWWDAGEDGIMRSFHNFYASLNITKVIKWRMRRVVHVTSLGEMWNA